MRRRLAFVAALVALGACGCGQPVFDARSSAGGTVSVRVIWQDGRALAITYDLRPARINVAVRGDRVVRLDGPY